MNKLNIHSLLTDFSFTIKTFSMRVITQNL